jgi:ribosomal protein L29
MNFLKRKIFKDKKNSQKIIILIKELCDLKLKQATKQRIKPHLFQQNKRKISQLLTLTNTKN